MQIPSSGLNMTGQNILQKKKLSLDEIKDIEELELEKDSVIGIAGIISYFPFIWPV